MVCSCMDPAPRVEGDTGDSRGGSNRRRLGKVQVFDCPLKPGAWEDTLDPTKRLEFSAFLRSGFSGLVLGRRRCSLLISPKAGWALASLRALKGRFGSKLAGLANETHVRKGIGKHLVSKTYQWVQACCLPTHLLVRACPTDLLSRDFCTKGDVI